MSYIGRSPQIGGYHKLDSITCDGSTAYTMQLDSANFTPESANHLIVSVNGVIQAPTDSFTVSGSTITFASSLSVSDTIDFIMALGNTLDIGVPSDSTVSLSKLTATGTKDATTFLRGDNTFAVPSGETNTPAFHAYSNTTTSASNNTLTIFKVDTEEFDTDNCYNTGTYTFQPTTAGKYYVYVSAKFGNTIDFDECFAGIYMNGTTRVARSQFRAEHSPTYHVARIIEFNGTTDYVQPFVFQNSGGTENFSTGAEYSFFGAYKLIGA